MSNTFCVKTGWKKWLEELRKKSFKKSNFFTEKNSLVSNCKIHSPNHYKLCIQLYLMRHFKSFLNKCISTYLFENDHYTSCLSFPCHLLGQQSVVSSVSNS